MVTTAASYSNKLPANLVVRPLRSEEWELVRETYEREFENAMPGNPEQSMFLGAFLDEKLIGFAHIETLFHLNAVFFEDEYRHKGFCQVIFNQIDELMPNGYALIILPDKNFARLKDKFNVRDLGKIDVWRKDYDSFGS